MIEENYYLGFERLCKRNKKIVVVPSKEVLEKFGCKITSMCYLVDNAGRQYNPSIIDPDIMDIDLRDAFKNDVSSENTISKDTANEIAELITTADASVPVMETKKALTEKACDDCGNSKVLTDFRRKAGRGLNYHNVCKVCEASQKPKVVEKDSTPKTVPEPLNAVVSPVVKQYLSTEKAKALILEAYNIGYARAKEDMLEDNNISVDEILKDAGIFDEKK